MRRIPSNQDRSNRGTTLIPTLVALLILSGVTLTMLNAASARRKNVQMDERRTQAEWLVDSGLERAAARVRASAEYSGETWDIPSVELQNRGAGVVMIKVSPPENGASKQRVRIDVEFPKGEIRQARVGRDFFIQSTKPLSGDRQ